jgi:hypothetical protein
VGVEVKEQKHQKRSENMGKKRKSTGKKWGKIGAPHSAKRKKWLAHLRRKR